MKFSRLAANNLSNTDTEDSPAIRFRKKRLELFGAMIDALFNKGDEIRVADIGGLRSYWELLPASFFERYSFKISIVNVPGVAPGEDSEIFSHLVADGCDLGAFASNSFDIAHSNSVLEHVGDFSRRELFAAEIRRIAKYYFIQTPNFWFPLEPHFFLPFFHWLPKSIRCHLVRRYALGHFERAESKAAAKALVDSCNLITASRMQKLFPDSRLYRERYWGLTKSLVAIKDD